MLFRRMLNNRCYKWKCVRYLLMGISGLITYLYLLDWRADWTMPKWNEIHKDDLQSLYEDRTVKFRADYSDGDSWQVSNDMFMHDMGFHNHSFNAIISHNIGPYRALPDTRHRLCPRTPTDPLESLPTISVVMCFYNEHKMTLVRSLMSIIKRTPPHLLQEIILVDDNSDALELKFNLLPDLHAQLVYDGLRYTRNAQREGLIRSRVIGARQAVGDVLVFLDSHIEVNQQWAEPLLRLIKKENSTLALPLIDRIIPNTIDYVESPLACGGFDWNLRFKWNSISPNLLRQDEDFLGPFKSPTMYGGMFAVNRQYFHDMGEYDMGMDLWGGENLEISFRVWQCGGAIKMVPCSRVGHIFRKRRPYAAPADSDTVLRNLLRVAHVWMDEYKKYFLWAHSDTANMDYGDVSERVALRQRLNCRGFDWYAHQISAEYLPMGRRPQSSNKYKRNYTSSFLIRLSDTPLCASVMGLQLKNIFQTGSTLTLVPCYGTRNQVWFETNRGEFILGDQLCLESYNRRYALIQICHEQLDNQHWRYLPERGLIYNEASDMCLHVSDIQMAAVIGVSSCSNDTGSRWELLEA